MKVVLVGCGGISRAWLESLKHVPQLELVGMVDLNEGVAKQRAAEFKFRVPIGSNLKAMIDQAKPELVFDCTVPPAHHEVTLTALRAGCHVFGEKPLADTFEQALEMVEQTKESGKTFATMQNRRYDPNIRKVAEVLRNGLIGDLTTVHADFFIAAHFGGFREEMAHVLIKDMAIHTFDAARLLTGLDARTVYCHEWNPKDSWYERDASALAIFEMTEDVVFSYRGSWCSEGLLTPWECEWRIIGTKGSLSWNGSTGLRCEIVKTAEGFIFEHEQPDLPALEPASPPSWHSRAIKAFVEALEAGLEPETICTDNIKSLAMVLAAVESSELGKRVEVFT